MHMATVLTINGETKSFDAPPDMPLLWVLRDVLGMTGTKFGCGIAQCGACTVHVDGQPMRSCSLPLEVAQGSQITTIEAVAGPEAVAVQDAWIARDVLGMSGTKFGCGIAQCGACTVHVDGKAVRSCVLPVSAVANSSR